jgi:CRISPR-associated protein Cmr1
MRKLPAAELQIPPSVMPVARPDIITQRREYELITPLFGGGVEPGYADPVTVVRIPGMRGHLRFWWRATRGGHFNGDLKEMKKKEDEIWGATSTAEQPAPSAVQIKVTCTNEGSPDHPFEISPRGKPQAREGSTAPAYAAFPLQPSDEEARQLRRNNAETKAVYVGVQFFAEISFRDEHRREVEAALWAWETFGGIGARTRRGFGALRVAGIQERKLGEEKWQKVDVDLPISTDVVKKWIQDKFTAFEIKGKWPESVPNLSNSLSQLKVVKAQVEVRGAGGKGKGQVTRTTVFTTQEVWEYLIFKLKKFRQARYDKDQGKSVDNDYGLSHWPEANEIRRRLNPTTEMGQAAVIRKFPRARLGLPINFHFPHDQDAPDVELVGTESKRRASPLILRPLVCADGKTIGLAVVLFPTILPPDPLRLVGVPNDSQRIEVDLSKAEAVQIPPLHLEQDIIKAFLSTL